MLISRPFFTSWDCCIFMFSHVHNYPLPPNSYNYLVYFWSKTVQEWIETFSWKWPGSNLTSKTVVIGEEVAGLREEENCTGLAFPRNSSSSFRQSGGDEQKWKEEWLVIQFVLVCSQCLAATLVVKKALLIAPLSIGRHSASHSLLHIWCHCQTGPPFFS